MNKRVLKVNVFITMLSIVSILVPVQKERNYKRFISSPNTNIEKVRREKTILSSNTIQKIGIN